MLRKKLKTAQQQIQESENREETSNQAKIPPVAKKINRELSAKKKK